MYTVINTVGWCAVFAALFLGSWTALRFIMYGDIVDFICMVVSTVCLVLLVAAVTA